MSLALDYNAVVAVVAGDEESKNLFEANHWLALLRLEEETGGRKGGSNLRK